MEQKKRLLYVSSLPEESRTGGANAVNFHVYKELQKYFDCAYLHIDIPPSRKDRLISKLRRKLFHLPGRFDFFSEKRLDTIKHQFETYKEPYDFVFFRGFTPWIHIAPSKPYFAYNDVDFRQYFENTFAYKSFYSWDIERIIQSEGSWLSKTKKVFFESGWGARKALFHNNLNKERLVGLGRGGSIPFPETDQYRGSLQLLLVANHFLQKGGDLAYQAFCTLRQTNSEVTFHIVGGDPGKEISNAPGVVYHGFLRKEQPSDLEKLVTLYSEAFLLLHPTREDTNPLVITEAGYFGCPAISVERFAIPELIRHRETGLLLKTPLSATELANAIQMLIDDEKLYRAMRNNVMIFSRSVFSWETIGSKLRDCINQ